MLWKALHELDYWFSVVGLVIIAVGTIVAGLIGGWRTAGTVGILLFLFLDGYECLRTVATHSDAGKRHDDENARAREHFIEKTKDNPTIR